MAGAVASLPAEAILEDLADRQAGAAEILFDQDGGRPAPRADGMYFGEIAANRRQRVAAGHLEVQVAALLDDVERIRHCLAYPCARRRSIKPKAAAGLRSFAEPMK